MEIKYKELNKVLIEPKQAHESDGGFDVIATEIIEKDEDFVICKLGFACELPEGHKLTLVPRSSLTGTQWVLQNSPGLGDFNYRGEYQFRFRAIPNGIKEFGNFITRFIYKLRGLDVPKYYLSYPEFPFKVGDRIGQVYLETVIPTTWTKVDELGDTVRGAGGFGSTGNETNVVKQN